MICSLALIAAIVTADGGRAGGQPPRAEGVAAIPLLSIYRHEYLAGSLVDEDTLGVVFVFMSTHCPIVDLSAGTLRELHARFAERGAVFVGVYSNSGDHVMAMAAHAQSIDVPFVVMKDKGNRLADAFKVEHTSEVVVTDREFHVKYQGAIDDQFYKGGAKPAALHRYLEEALEALLSGNPAPTSFTQAAGCRIERERETAPTPRTYYEDVAGIIQSRCTHCHREGEAAPFALETYEDARDNADMIVEVVTDRRMPPWYAESPRGLSHDPRLSDAEVRTIQEWFACGAPPGDERNRPAGMQYADPKQWKIGKPDFVYRMDKPFTVPATGTVNYQYYRIKADFPTDRWIQAFEVRPGNRRVVHHIQVHEVQPGEGEFTALDMLRLYGLSIEEAHLVGSYTPGNAYNSRMFGPEQGMRIRAHKDLIFELHYTPYGKEAEDQSEIGYIFRDAPPEHEIKSFFFFKKRGRFLIPPGEQHHVMSDTYSFPQDVRILAIRPHFHARGKSYRLDVVYPSENDRREPLLTVPAWDFNWQHTYEFREPVVLPAGTELVATGVFDNSRFNPANPDPMVEVEWGQQTHQEMFNTLVIYEEIPQESVPQAAGR